MLKIVKKEHPITPITKSHSKKQALEKIFLFGVGVTNATEKEILEYILHTLKKTTEKYYIVTPNPENIIFAKKHPGFKRILNDARLGLCDGIGVMWAGKILGKKLKDRVTGVDIMENLCKEVAKKPITVGFLGGRHKVAEKTAECLQEKYPGLQVIFISEEWKEYNNYKTIDILFVAFGFPKQEEWMSKNLSNIPVRVAIGVGGAFDYISGRVGRAPRLTRLLGFEWLYRLFREPWRIKRQMALLEFALMVAREKLGV